MFQKIMIPMILIVSALAQAQIDHQILQQIEKANNFSVAVPQSTDPCDACSAEKTATGLFNSCIQKICSDQGLLPYTQIPKIEDKDLSTPAPNEPEIDKLFQQLGTIKSPFSSEAQKNQLIELLKAKKLKFSAETMQLAMQTMAVSLAARAMRFDAATGKFSLDGEKWKSLPVSHISKQNRSALKEHAKVYIDTLGSVSDWTLLDNPDAYLSSKYPGVSKPEAVKKLVAEFRDDFANLRKTTFGVLISQVADPDFMFPRELASSIESGRDVTEAALKELIKSKNSFNLVSKAFDPKYYTNAAKLIDEKDLKKLLTDSRVLAETISSVQKQDEKDRQKNADNRISCLSIYRRNLLILPTKSQIERLQSEIGLIKKAVGEKWAPRYSHETQKKIQTYLSKVQFHLPDSKDQFAEGLKTRLQREIETKKRQADLKIKDPEALAFFLALTNLNDNFKSAEERNKPVDSFCEGDKVSALDDANYTLQGRIQVSYTSAHAIEMGRGVLAHEIGHGISQIFKSNSASDESSRKHQKWTDCLASLHTKNGLQYVEEDYADFVSANVTTVNKACLYPHSLPAKIPAVENEFAQDSHSSHFFRLLHLESIQKGRLPDKCNQLLVEQRTPTDFLRCQNLSVN